MSQLLGYTGPVSAEQMPDLRPKGYQPDDLIGKVGLEAEYETELRGTYGSESVARDETGRRTQVLQTVQEAVPGASLTLTIDTKAQKDAEKALKWAMKKIGMTRGVVIAMNPQTGEILAMVSLPTYDNNLFARGISQTDLREVAQQQGQAAAQPRDPGALRAGIDLQARRRHGRPGRPEDHAPRPRS